MVSEEETPLSPKFKKPPLPAQAASPKASKRFEKPPAPMNGVLSTSDPNSIKESHLSAAPVNLESKRRSRLPAIVLMLTIIGSITFIWLQLKDERPPKTQQLAEITETKKPEDNRNNTSEKAPVREHQTTAYEPAESTKDEQATDTLDSHTEGEASYKLNIYSQWEDQVVQSARDIALQDGGLIVAFSKWSKLIMVELCGAPSMQFKVNGKNVEIEPEQFIMDCLFRPDLARDLPTFRIDNPDVISSLATGDLPEEVQRLSGIDNASKNEVIREVVKDKGRRDRYSYAELEPIAPILLARVQKIRKEQPSKAKMTSEQRDTVDLGDKIWLFSGLIYHMDFARADIEIQEGTPAMDKIQEGTPAMDKERMKRMSYWVRSFPLLRKAVLEMQPKVEQLPPGIMSLFSDLERKMTRASGDIRLLPPYAEDSTEWLPVGKRIEEVLTGKRAHAEALISDMEMMEEMCIALRDQGQGAFGKKLNAWKKSMHDRLDAVTLESIRVTPTKTRGANLESDVRKSLQNKNNGTSQQKQVYKTIPAKFWGKWGSGDGEIEISKTKIRLWESELTPSKIELLEEGNALRLSGVESGEGDTWNAEHFFRLSLDGKYLTNKYEQKLMHSNDLGVAKNTIPPLFHGSWDPNNGNYSLYFDSHVIKENEHEYRPLEIRIFEQGRMIRLSGENYEGNEEDGELIDWVRVYRISEDGSTLTYDTGSDTGADFSRAASDTKGMSAKELAELTLSKTIPAAFLGSWAPNEYVSINIHPDKIEGYEGDWFPDKIEVTEDGKTIHLFGVDQIEGELFKRKQTLKISDDGSTLIIEGKGYSVQYNRSEPGPPKGG